MKKIEEIILQLTEIVNTLQELEKGSKNYPTKSKNYPTKSKNYPTKSKNYPTKSKNVTDRITDFLSACLDLDIKTHGDAFKLLNLKRTIGSEIPIEQCDDISLKLMICTYALNEGHIFNWSDDNLKYFPWFDMSKKPGSGFDRSCYVGWSSSSLVSSRLAYKTSELALYGSKVLESLYYEYMLQN